MAGIILGQLVYAQRRARTFKQRLQPTEIYSDRELVIKYRFNREGIEYVTDLIRDDVLRSTRRNHSLTATQVVCIALRFYASGSFQEVNMSQGSQRHLES